MLLIYGKIDMILVLRKQSEGQEKKMKIDRLIGILSILLQKEQVTAPYLAEKFEVSRRTINRDIEDICKAGIPLVTRQGQNGGISIMEGYRLDNTLLTTGDMRAILTGLRSLDSVSGTNKYQQLMEKLSAGSNTVLSSDRHIAIDLSSWYTTSLTYKIELIQNAIERREYIKFDYCAPVGEGQRSIEPYLLVFQWSSWYVWGYCSDREEFRLFKLNRMLTLINTGQCFKGREVIPYETSAQTAFPVNIEVAVLCESQIKWKLIEEYSAESYEEQPDGKLLFRFGFTNKENLMSWLLSLGNQAELLEPESIRRELAVLTEEMYKIYHQ